MATSVITRVLLRRDHISTLRSKWIAKSIVKFIHSRKAITVTESALNGNLTLLCAMTTLMSVTIAVTNAKLNS